MWLALHGSTWSCPTESGSRESPVFFILMWPVGVSWVWHGTHAEGWCLPLCPHQVLWGPRKPWGLTHTLTPSAACDSGPDVLGWVGPTWFEHLRIVRGCLSTALSQYPWVPPYFCSHCSLTMGPALPCQAWPFLCTRCSFCLEHLSPALSMAGSSFFVKSQLKCHLLRGAFPDLSMQSGPLFHFLS